MNADVSADAGGRGAAPAEIRLQRAGVDDADLFLAIDRSADTRGYVVAHDRARHRANLRDPAQVCLRIVADGTTVGYFVLVPEADGRSVEFRRIVIADKGRGIGQRAIRLMERFCREELGRSRVWLDVFEHNERGRHVYEKLGYRRCGERDYDGVRAFIHDKTLEPGPSGAGQSA